MLCILFHQEAEEKLEKVAEEAESRLVRSNILSNNSSDGGEKSKTELGLTDITIDFTVKNIRSKYNILQGNLFWTDASWNSRKPGLPGRAIGAGQHFDIKWTSTTSTISRFLLPDYHQKYDLKVSFAGASLITSFFLARRGKAFLLPGQDLELAVTVDDGDHGVDHGDYGDDGHGHGDSGLDIGGLR